MTFTGWNELLIAGFAHQSTAVKDRIMLVSGLNLSRENAQHAGLQIIFDRVLLEIVSKMREMLIDKTELGCMRAIVLFKPGQRKLPFFQMNCDFSSFHPRYILILFLITIGMLKESFSLRVLWIRACGQKVSFLEEGNMLQYFYLLESDQSR